MKLLKYCLFFLLFFSILASLNWLYQVTRKPAEILALLAGGRLNKSVASTWDTYYDYFKQHETPVITAEFLAAMAQIESGGNSLATPRWRWRWTTDIRNIYAPASSSVGLFQYINSTFEDGKRFCVHNGKVAFAGKWYDRKSCWFNSFYSRLSASDSIEITAASLHYYVEKTLDKRSVSLNKKQELAAVIHLCGKRKGKQFVKLNFNFSRLPLCGSHNAGNYYKKIKYYQNKLESLNF